MREPERNERLSRHYPWSLPRRLRVGQGLGARLGIGSGLELGPDKMCRWKLSTSQGCGTRVRHSTRPSCTARRAAVEQLDARLQDKRALLTLAERVYGSSDAQGLSRAAYLPERTAISSGPGTMGMLLQTIKTGGLWEPQTLLTQLFERGWTTESAKPIAVISGALGRLVQTEGGVEKVGHGQYRWRSDVMERISDP